MGLKNHVKEIEKSSIHIANELTNMFEIFVI